MANKAGVLPVPIMPGMREDLDPASMPIGVPTLLRNVRCYQQGRLDKRPGTKLLETDGLPDEVSSTWLSQQGGRAIVGLQEPTGSTDLITYPVYAQRSDDDDAAWTRIGAHGAIVPVRRFGLSPQSTTGVKHVSNARVGDLLYVTFTEVSGAGTTTRIQVTTLDGSVLRAAHLLAASNTRLVYVPSSGILYFVYRDTGSTGGDDIKVSVLDQGTLALGAAVTLTTAGGADFDVAQLDGGGDWIMAASLSSVSIGIYRLTGTAISASTTITTVGSPTHIGINGTSATNVLVGWVEASSTVKVSFRNSSTLAAVATHTVDTAAGSEAWRYQVGFVRISATVWIMTFGGDESTSAPALPHAFFKFIAVQTAGVGGLFKVDNFGLASKPFISGVAAAGYTVYVWAHTQGDATLWRSQAKHYVLELDVSTLLNQTDNVNLAAISYEHIASYGTSTSFQQHLTSVEGFGSGLFAAVLNWADPTLTGVDVAVFTAARRADSVRASHRFVGERSGALLVSGGCLYEDTGARGIANLSSLGTVGGYLVENGFPYEPELVSDLAAGGSLTSGQEYTFRAVYRWTDTLGRVHRSAPGPAVTETPSGGNLSVLMRVPSLMVSGRSNSGIAEVETEFYRSWLGGPFYYVGSVASGIGVTETFTDTLSDASAESSPVLYTDLGILPTYPPSGARLWCDGGTRVFSVGWRENVVQFSKLIIPTAPLEFVDDDAFRVFLPEPITAIWYLDGTLVVFCRYRVFTVSGDGPDDQGVGRYSDPHPLPVTVTCEDARSLVEVPQGLFFKGGGTIWLMPRGFGPPIPVGDAIANTLETFSHVRSAVVTYGPGVDGGARCVHYTLTADDVDGSGDVVAVYDLELGTWSLDSIGGPLIGPAAAIGGNYCWAAAAWETADTTAPLRRLSSTEYQDYDENGDPLWIESRIALGEIRPFGPVGWGRISKVQINMAERGACSMALLSTMDGTTTQDVTTFSGVTGDRYREHAFPNAPCCALQLTLVDAIGITEGAVPTQGIGWRFLALEVQPEAGLRRVATNGTERF